MPPKTIKQIPRPGKLPDRQLEELSRSTQDAVSSLDLRVTALETPLETDRIYPADQYTAIWYPCADDPLTTALSNAGTSSAPPLVIGANAALADVGVVTRQALRMYGTSAGRGATAQIAGPTFPVPISVSYWARHVDIGGGGFVSYIFSNHNATASDFVFQSGVNTSGIPIFAIKSAAGLRSSTVGKADQQVSNGEWHFYVASYDGRRIRTYVDGIEHVEDFGSYSEINWTVASGPAFYRIGIAGNSNGGRGVVQDVRLHTCIRDQAWAKDAYDYVMAR